MPDSFIRDDYDFIHWVRSTVEGSGAIWHDPPRLTMGAAPITVLGQPDGIAVDMQPHYLRWDGSEARLKVALAAFTLDAHLPWQYVTYSFHFEAKPGRMVFRYDKHPEPSFERKHKTDCAIGHSATPPAAPPWAVAKLHGCSSPVCLGLGRWGL